jgi:2,4-dichlorophenol 6-monooxygenase
MSVIEVPVLIAGGGTCGLAASNFLLDYNIDHLLAERHTGTAHVPKAHYLNQRTMEIFRQHGLAEMVAEQAAPVEKLGKIRWQTSLAGSRPLDARLIHEMDAYGGGSLRERYAADSPMLPSNLSQMRLEPLLRGNAERRAPGRLRFGHELAEFTDEGDRITALIVDRETGERHTVRAKYLIGADGGKTVGPALGVRLEGPTGLAGVATLHFSADLSAWTNDDTLITWLINPNYEDLLRATLIPMGPTWGKDSEEWALHLSFAPNDPVRFDEANAVSKIREVLGLPELELQLHHISYWVLEAVLADRYRVGRVFLAGDAVHRHPPATGIGMNTAIQDVHNLAWKLAAVLHGHAGDGLLDTYESERRPIGRRNVDWATSASLHHQVITEAALGLGSHLPPQMRTTMFHAYFDESAIGETIRARAAEIFRTNRAESEAHDIEIGFAYQQGALVPDGTGPPPRSPMGDVYYPTTRPGHRLPHAWLKRTDERLSTLDLVGRGACFLLITGPDGTAWREAAEQAADRFGIVIRTASIGVDGDWADAEGVWTRVRQIKDDGAILVRPDNHVAWRGSTQTDPPAQVLPRALQAVLAC